jgi:hypothetical protein
MGSAAAAAIAGKAKIARHSTRKKGKRITPTFENFMDYLLLSGI